MKQARQDERITVDNTWWYARTKKIAKELSRNHHVGVRCTLGVAGAGLCHKKAAASKPSPHAPAPDILQDEVLYEVGRKGCTSPSNLQ